MITVENPDSDSPSVKVPPPFALLFVLLLALFCKWVFPAQFLIGGFRWVLGGTVFFSGFILMLWSAKLFKKSETNIEPWKPTLVIIKGGPYRFSRNPIYLSFMIIALGVICLVNNAYAFLLLFPLFLFLNFYVIKKEEAYLTSKFGQAYLEYKESTRRWL